MNPLVSDVIDSVSRRIRDANNTAHTRALHLDLLDRVQVAFNARQKYVLSTVTLTTTPGKSIYTLESDLQGITSVTGVTFQDLDVAEFADWRSLWKVNPRWTQGNGGSIPDGYTTIGRTLFVIHPVPSVAYDIVVEGTARTTELLSETQQMAFRPEDTSLVKDAVFNLLLVRQKDMEISPLHHDRLAAKLGIRKVDQDERLEE